MQPKSASNLVKTCLGSIAKLLSQLYETCSSSINIDFWVSSAPVPNRDISP